MSCQCQDELAKNITDRTQKMHPDWFDIKVKLLSYGLTMTDNNMAFRGFMPISIEAERPLKKGGTRVKKEKTSLFFSYCPFCGVKVNDKNEGGEA